jgi:hypothetical protein
MFTAPHLRRLVQVADASHPRELACEDCFEQVDRFAELVLAGRDAAEAMPLVHEHLEHCPECKDEFEVFLDVLRASESAGEPKAWWRRWLRRRGR